MRKTLTTVALLLALCCPAFAGLMHTPVKSDSEPPPQSTQETTDGDIQNGLVQLALNLIALF